jgi:dUTP pyrophosphatase
MASLCMNDLKYQNNNFMLLKVFVDDESTSEKPSELKQKYIDASIKHNQKISDTIELIDAGFDLFAPSTEEQIRFYHNKTNKLDFKIKCSATIHDYKNTCVFNTGFYMYPRSSISKTNLRLANSVGIIDSGYRGNLMSMLDVVNSNGQDYIGAKYDRYIQICAPSLLPIVIEIVHKLEDLGVPTERGTGGFGSTGR